MIQSAEKIKNARSETITREKLTEQTPSHLRGLEEDYYVTKQPVIDYFDKREQPHFLFHSKLRLDENHPDGPSINTVSVTKGEEDIFDYRDYDTPGGLVVVFTNKRALLIPGGIEPLSAGFLSIFSSGKKNKSTSICYDDLEQYQFTWANERTFKIGSRVRHSIVHKLILERSNSETYEISIPEEYDSDIINELLNFLDDIISDSRCSTSNAKK